MNNSTPSQCFEYRAYNSDLKVVEGRTEALSFQHLAITLRQQGLQVIDATAINPDGRLAGDRLEKMKRRLTPETPSEEETATPGWSIRGMFSALIHLFRKG